MTTRRGMRQTLAVTLALLWMTSSVAAQELNLPPEPLGDLPGPVKRALFRAQELRNEEKPAEAAKVLNECLERYGQFDGHALRLHLASALYLVGSTQQNPDSARAYFENAKTHYEASVRHNDASAQGWLHLGRTCYELGDYECTMRAFVKLNSLLPEPNASVQLSAGVAAHMAQRPARAYELLSELVNGKFGPPPLEWCRAYVAAAHGADRTRDTFPVLRALVEREPGNPEAWQLLYQAAGMMADYEQAAAALTIVDFIQPSDVQQLVQLGDLYMQIDVPAKAAPYYERALATPDANKPADLRERLAGAYVTAHDYENAIRFLDAELRKNPTARMWSFLGDVHYARDDYEEALSAFRESSKLDPGNGRAFLMMGYCAYQLERNDEARTHLLAAAGFDDQRDAAQQLLRALAR